ncbi:hypothetical protein BOX15_Mlig017456g1, partial [Macrostomum lignano]
TLVINACAILNFKLRDEKQHQFEFEDASRASFGDKTREFLRSLRYFRVFIGLWNIFVILLMLTVFSS